MTNPEETTGAKLTIEQPGGMTPKRRQQIAAWLQQQAAKLVKDGKNYTDTGYYVARYRYPVTSL